MLESLTIGVRRMHDPSMELLLGRVRAAQHRQLGVFSIDSTIRKYVEQVWEHPASR